MAGCWGGRPGGEGAAFVEMAVFHPTQTLQEGDIPEITAGAAEGARATKLSSTLPRARGANGIGSRGSNGDNRLIIEEFKSGGDKGEIVIREVLGPRALQVLSADCLLSDCWAGTL